MNPREVVDEFYGRIWNAGDLAAIDEVLAPDVRFRGSLGADVRGRAAVADYVTTVRSALTDYTCTVIETVEEADRCFARMRFRGIHTGELLGFAATGCVIEWDGAALFHVSDGLITDVWVLADRADVIAQLRGDVTPGERPPR